MNLWLALAWICVCYVIYQIIGVLILLALCAFAGDWRSHHTKNTDLNDLTNLLVETTKDSSVSPTITIEDDVKRVLDKNSHSLTPEELKLLH